MSGLTEIQVLRAEVQGWEESALGCYVSANNNLLDVITPINSAHDESKVQLPCKATLRLIVKSMRDSDEYLGSVSVLVRALPARGYVWLPLQSDMNNDFLEQLPDSSAAPRVLLAISCEVSEPPSAASQDNPHLKVQYEKVLALNKALEQSNQLLTDEVKAQQRTIQQLESCLESAKEQIINQTTQAAKAEESLLALLQQKDEFIAELQVQTLQVPQVSNTDVLKQQIEGYKRQCHELTTALSAIGGDWELCKEAEMQQSSAISRLNAKVTSLKAELAEENSRRQETESELAHIKGSHSKDLQSLRLRYEKQLFSSQETHDRELRKREETTRVTSRQHEFDLKTVRDEYLILQSAHAKLQTTCAGLEEQVDELQRKQPLYDFDTQLGQTVNSLNLSTELIHSHEQFYVYRNAVIELELIRDQIYVRTLSGFVLFEEFIEKQREASAERRGNSESAKLADSKYKASSRRFLHSTLSHQHKVRSLENVHPRNRLDSSERKRPFK